MTESKYNEYNFEANFDKYLRKSDISRTHKRTWSKFFNDYYNYLKLNFPAKEFGNPEKLFTAKTLSSFKKIFLAKYRTQTRWHNFKALLLAYKEYLYRQENTYLTVSENNNKYQQILSEYLNYLKHKSFSASTLKNYQVDLKQLFSYLEMNSFILDDLLNPQIQTSYAYSLSAKSNLASDSVKRKLSAISSFHKWLLQKEKVKDTISFKNTEAKPKYQQKTGNLPQMKNLFQPSKFFYPFLILILSVSLSLGIFHGFFNNVPTPQAYPVINKPPSRILSFQGRLTDKDGNPTVDKTDISFRLWDKKSGGIELYSSGVCSIIPDQNGIFYSIIGSTCGQEIPSSVFSENTSIFLGIKAGNDNEMEPRQQIASVGFALNSETVQGLQPQSPAEKSTIPFINKDGELLIGIKDPKIKSNSGNFTLEGNSLSINARDGSNGNLHLNPDGNGSINLNFEGFFASNSGLLNIVGQNILSGNLISAIGSSLTAGYKLIDLSSGNPISTKFSVDSSGNTFIAGNILANSFQSSSSGTLVNSNLDINGQIFDGGLGIYGSLGNRLSTSFNFTKNIAIEFNFKTGSKKIEVHANINDDSSKYYLFTWGTDGKMTVEKCIPGCSVLASDNFSWANDTWHDGYLSFSGNNLKWSIDKDGKTINTTASADVPALSSGYLKFSNAFVAINNLVISPSTDLVLTAFNSWIGGKLATGDNITTTGKVGVGNTDPNERLDVEGNVEIDASSTSYTQRLCHSGADGDTNDLKLGDCSAGGADIAEYYSGDKDISHGDIVAIKEGAYQIKLDRIGETSKAYITKSSKGYQNNLIGIVSTNPHSEILAEGVFTSADNPVPVALAGRIPINVSSENGIINTGDLITSGNIPGFGMKASSSGFFVAKALESFPQDEQKLIPCPKGTPSHFHCARIIAFINLSFYNKTISEDQLNDLALLPGERDSLFDQISSLVENKFDSLTSLKTTSLQSAVIEAENISTNYLSVDLISPLKDSEEIKINGDVTLFGQLNTESITTKEATISGTLYANNIESDDLNNLKTSFGELAAKIASQTATPQPSPSASPVIPSITPSPTINESIETEDSATDSGMLSNAELYKLISDSDLNTQNLLNLNQQLLSQTTLVSPENLVKVEGDVKLSGKTSLADTSIAGQLMIDGQIVINYSSITTLTETLFINSPKLIDIMGGKLLVDQTGNLTVKGELIAEKGITTNEINGKDNQLTINLNQSSPNSTASADRIGSPGELKVLGNTEIQGNLSAWKLNLESKPSSASNEKILSATENFLTYNNNAPGILTAKTAGTSTIPATYQEFYIYNKLLSKQSLIYLTPSSSTQNKTIYISSKNICTDSSNPKCESFFVIALDSPSTKDISFNWWFVN